MKNFFSLMILGVVMCSFASAGTSQFESLYQNLKRERAVALATGTVESARYRLSRHQSVEARAAALLARHAISSADYATEKRELEMAKLDLEEAKGRLGLALSEREIANETAKGEHASEAVLRDYYRSLIGHEARLSEVALERAKVEERHQEAIVDRTKGLVARNAVTPEVAQEEQASASAARAAVKAAEEELSLTQTAQARVTQFQR
jgi:hypothetical protein